jgi:hypothetical protein
MSRCYRNEGNADSWRFDRKPMDASQRLKAHGPILPMEDRPTGLLARIWGKRHA